MRRPVGEMSKLVNERVLVEYEKDMERDLDDARSEARSLAQTMGHYIRIVIPKWSGS